VDGAKQIRLWGETHPVRAKIHTIGGLSAHADQENLVNWYKHFTQRPNVVLVHGEETAMTTLAAKVREECGASVRMPQHGEHLHW
jgi:metallo-beta-lactamase family protein